MSDFQLGTLVKAKFICEEKEVEITGKIVQGWMWFRTVEETNGRWNIVSVDDLEVVYE